MALTAKTLILYDLQVDSTNFSIDFKISAMGDELMASIEYGFYSLSGLMSAIKIALEEADPSNVYTITADRTQSSGTQNRITISTSGAFLSLLFGSGTRAASTVAPLIGFTSTDKTGATTYTGTSSAGTVLIPTLIGYNYLPPEMYRKVFGSLNISTIGEKEAIVFQVQQFFQMQFKYEPQSYVLSDWTPFINWAIQQAPFEVTPEITSPNTFYDCTLEKTVSDGQGLAHSFKEMLPDFPFLYDTQLLTFRRKVT